MNEVNIALRLVLDPVDMDMDEPLVMMFDPAILSIDVYSVLSAPSPVPPVNWLRTSET